MEGLEGNGTRLLIEQGTLFGGDGNVLKLSVVIVANCANGEPDPFNG